MRFGALVEALEGVMDGRTDDAIVVAVLTVGAGLITAALADGPAADRVGAVCLDRVGRLVKE